MFNTDFKEPSLLDVLQDDALRDSFNKYMKKDINSSKKSRKMYDDYVMQNVRVAIIGICDILSVATLDTLLHSEPLATYIPNKDEDGLIGYAISTRDTVSLTPLATGVANKLISGTLKRKEPIVELVKHLSKTCFAEVSDPDSIKFLLRFCDDKVNITDLYEYDKASKIDIVPLMSMVNYIKSDYHKDLSSLPSPDSIEEDIPKLSTKKFLDSYDFPSVCATVMTYFLTTTKYLKLVYAYGQYYYYKLYGKFTTNYNNLHPQVFYFIFDDMIRGYIREVYNYTFIDTRNVKSITDMLPDNVNMLSEIAVSKINTEYDKYKETAQKEIDNLKKQLEDSKKSNAEYREIISDLRNKEADFKNARAMKKEAHEMTQTVDKLNDEIADLTEENRQLREQLYEQSKVKESTSEEKTPLTTDEIKELLYPYKITIVGGHINTVNRLKETFPDWKYFDGDATLSTVDLSPDNYHVILTRYLGHRVSKKVLSNVPEDHIIYCNDINVDKILETVTDYFLEE